MKGDNMNRYNLRLFDDPSIVRDDVAALISEQAAPDIIQAAIEQSAVLSMGRKLQNMTSAQTRLPVLGSLPVAYFVDGDTGRKKTTKARWDKKVINAAELAVIVPMPAAVIDDADYDIIAEVTPRLGEAFGREIDAAVLFGNGKPAVWPDGVVTQAIAAGAVVNSSATLYDDLMGVGGVISKVEQAGYYVNGHIAAIAERAALRSIKDNTGAPLFVANMQDPTKYVLDGSPITFSRNGSFDKTKALMISGDFSNLVYAIRQDLDIQIFDQGVIQDAEGNIVYNLMQNDMIAIRATMRLGWELPNPVTAEGGEDAFPFAILAPAAPVADAGGQEPEDTETAKSAASAKSKG